jgi:transcriptional regulator with XRE-family HTH domain
VKGLRREEVAVLAGISAEYYTRLERGDMRGVSEEVLDGIARALQLDEGPHAPLRPGPDHQRRTRSGSPPSHPGARPAVIQRILDSVVGVPSFIENARRDVLARNPLGEAFYAPQFADPVRPINGARRPARQLGGQPICDDAMTR